MRKGNVFKFNEIQNQETDLWQELQENVAISDLIDLKQNDRMQQIGNCSENNF